VPGFQAFNEGSTRKEKKNLIFWADPIGMEREGDRSGCLSVNKKNPGVTGGKPPGRKIKEKKWEHIHGNSKKAK